jgi:hypothetical protein
MDAWNREQEHATSVDFLQRGRAIPVRFGSEDTRISKQAEPIIIAHRTTYCSNGGAGHCAVCDVPAPDHCRRRLLDSCLASRNAPQARHARLAVARHAARSNHPP